MATYSSVLAWRIPGTGEPGGLPSLGSQSQTQLKRLSSSSISFSYKDDRIRIQRKGHIGKGDKLKRSWNIKEMILMRINSF